MLGLRRAIFSVSGVLALVAGAVSLGMCDEADGRPATKAPAIDIWQAAAKGRPDAIRKHLRAGTDINGTFVQAGTPGSGGTPLHIAILADQMRAARLLSKRGADLNARADDEYGGTPLHWAAFIGNLEFVELLSGAGADVNATDRHGNTPLDAASDAGIKGFLREHGGRSKTDPMAVEATGLRGAYSRNGAIHVNEFGTPEGTPLTTGQMFSARMTELRNACVAKAHELGIGIVGMKVIGAGVLGAWSKHIVPGFDRKRLQQSPGAAIRHVLQDDRVHLLTIGMRLKEEIDANIESAAGDTTYTAGDRALLAEFFGGVSPPAVPRTVARLARRRAEDRRLAKELRELEAAVERSNVKT